MYTTAIFIGLPKVHINRRDQFALQVLDEEIPVSMLGKQIHERNFLNFGLRVLCDFVTGVIFIAVLCPAH